MRSSALKTLSLLTLFVALLAPISVFADTLFVSPLTGTYAVGNTFSVRIMVSSPRQAINAVSGILSFPNDKLQVVSVSKIGSVLSLWVQEPTFSNSRGTVTFEGVVPNPGFAESNGRVLGINFKVVGTGPAEVKLTSGSLLANDGYGTNVLKTIDSATYTLEARQQEVVSTPAALNEPEPAVIDLDLLPPPQAPEEPRTISFRLPFFGEVSDWFTRIMSLAIPLLALFFLLAYLLLHGFHRVRRTHQALFREVHDVDRLMQKSFGMLREEISDNIRLLERAKNKRALTREEDEIIRNLRQNLEDTERILHKELVKVQKHIS